MEYSFLAVLIFCAIYVFYTIKQYQRKEELKSLVAWCVVKDRSFRYNLDLREHVHNAQLEYVPKSYRISEQDEWSHVQHILRCFVSYLTDSYFSDYLYLPKSKYAISGDDYFMFSLCSFLEAHQCDFELSGQSMHKETISFIDYGTWGGMLYDAKYSLSDFALTYHKLYYISYMYCKSSPVINPKGKGYKREQKISDILDAGQIEISRY